MDEKWWKNMTECLYWFKKIVHLQITLMPRSWHISPLIEDSHSIEHIERMQQQRNGEMCAPQWGKHIYKINWDERWMLWRQHNVVETVRLHNNDWREIAVFVAFPIQSQKIQHSNRSKLKRKRKKIDNIQTNRREITTSSSCVTHLYVNIATALAIFDVHSRAMAAMSGAVHIKCKYTSIHTHLCVSECANKHAWHLVVLFK